MGLAMKRLINGIALCAAIVCTSQSAFADTFTYEFSWTGHSPYAAPGNSQWGDSDATAFATVVVQQDALGDPTWDQIVDVSMTVQNAASGNGVFKKEDFSTLGLSYRFLPNLVLGQRFQLSSYEIFSLSFFSNGGGAPSNFAEDAMWAGSVQGGTALYRGSMFVTRTSATAVPEPATYAMLLAGLGLLGVATRKRRAVNGNRR